MSDVKRIGVDEAKERVRQGWTYLDVRSVPEYAAGHPAGAHNVPYLEAAAGGMRPNPDFAKVVAALYSTDHKLVIGCQSGNRSMRAARELIAAGYDNLVELRPGYGGVKNAFGQVEEPGWAAVGETETSTEGASYDELRAKAGV